MIGNSDDKLSQQQWSWFVSDVHDLIMRRLYPIHFHALSVGSAPWQNACWVLDMNDRFGAITEIEVLREALGELAQKYHQDSIALTLGDTEFVKGE
jgi:hypothetical protein